MKNLIICLLLSMTLVGCTSTSNSAQAGYVRLQFDINTKGNPENIVVVKSEPEGFFEDAAVKALSKWKYKPKVVNGRAVKQLGLQVQLDFQPESK